VNEGDDREPGSGRENGEDQPGQSGKGQDIPGLTPESPGFQPAGRPGGAAPPFQWGQGYPGWQPPQKGLLGRHPLLVILLVLLVAAAALTIFSMALGKRSEGMSAMSFGKKVGVVKIEGLILDSKETVDRLHKFRDNDSIKAVVLRVESPGGVVGASQEIFEEVKKTADKKPVVVSMGSVAASGGYYVSAPATYIFANPGTITGSIGVVMEITNIEGLLDWMKIESYAIKSGKFKDAGSPYREMTEEERKYLQGFVDGLHLQFEDAIVEGRGLERSKVEEIADGRILSGRQARELGLVDEVGNLWDAIDEAAERGGIEGKPSVVWPPKPRSNPLEMFFSSVVPGWKETEKAVSPVRVMYVMDLR